MGDRKQTSSEEESLMTILDVTQRTNLTLLLAEATATMRESIEAIFDAAATAKPDIVTDLTSAAEGNDANPNVDPSTISEAEAERQQNALKERERELSGPKMIELRDAAFQFFDDWRSNMMGRVGEMVNSRGKAVEQTHSTHARSHPTQLSDQKIDPSTLSESIDADSALGTLYPPTRTPLSQLEEPKRLLILHSMLLLLLSLEHYHAPSRILLLHLTSSLRLPLAALTHDEETTAKSLLAAAKEMSGSTEQQQKAESNSSSRKWKVGLASVAGAAVIGITGGLAAPLVAAGVGSVMGGLGLGATAAAGYLGTVAGSTVIVGGLFGAYGGRMTGRMMDAYAKEVSDFAFLPVREPAVTAKSRFFQRHHASDEEAGKEEAANRRLRVSIGISGWLTAKEEVVTPWRVLGEGSEVFALRFELEALMNLGNSMMAMVSSAAWGYAKKEIIKRTIFADMMAAFWPLGLLKISRVVDNPFSVAKARADKAGEVLADALINRCQGERPVTLVGYSLGARVIYTCCLSLAKRRAFGLIESIVLMGAPTPSDSASWRLVRSVVSGRCVNVWSGNDYVLGFLYRTSSIQFGVAGMQAVADVAGVENIDVSDVVSGHLRYRYLVGVILKRVGFEDIDAAEIAKEEMALRVMDEEEAARKNKDDKQSEKDTSEGEDDAAAIERRVQARTQVGLEKNKADDTHPVSESHAKAAKPSPQKSYFQKAADQFNL